MDPKEISTNSTPSIPQSRPSRWGVPPPGLAPINNPPPTASSSRRPWSSPANSEPSQRSGAEKEILALRHQRQQTLRSFYLASNKNAHGSASIPPHFSLQSALMELSDADIETEALHARSVSIESSLARTREDAFAYTAASSASRADND